MFFLDKTLSLTGYLLLHKGDIFKKTLSLTGQILTFLKHFFIFFHSVVTFGIVYFFFVILIPTDGSRFFSFTKKTELKQKIETSLHSCLPIRRDCLFTFLSHSGYSSPGMAGLHKSSNLFKQSNFFTKKINRIFDCTVTQRFTNKNRHTQTR